MVDPSDFSDFARQPGRFAVPQVVRGQEQLRNVQEDVASRKKFVPSEKRRSRSTRVEAVSVRGILVPGSLVNVRNARYIQSGDRWILCTKNRQEIACFSSQEELLSWWNEFQNIQGLE